MYLCTHIPLQRPIKSFKSCIIKHKSCQKRGFARDEENVFKKKKSKRLLVLKTDVIGPYEIISCCYCADQLHRLCYWSHEQMVYTSFVNSRDTGQQKYLILRAFKKIILFQIYFFQKIHIFLVQSDICPKLKSLQLYFWNDSQALSPTFAALYWSGCQLQVLCFTCCSVTATLQPSPCVSQKKATSSKLCFQQHLPEELGYFQSLCICFFWVRKSCCFNDYLENF